MPLFIKSAQVISIVLSKEKGSVSFSSENKLETLTEAGVRPRFESEK